ncbi:hypothetical protein C8K30_105130 [Promicromonospora sp. AC04]|uniref:hypothetical protein n=1 Tax=Promicromonospora sp. AC04 TaxID=2135723 RepID=UPI000D49B26F|nr:hypothetical protein [Promicromonospora sp. AC04]PUB26903.1 hypothetical protein C8K30_105130 [Promicromonospora sp. AC04]
MSDEPIHADLVRVALERVEGAPFERFSNSFYASLVGATFIPLGGVKDGGADARDGTIYEDGSQVEHYFQASIEKDYSSKIRRTVARLRDFGRSPSSLTFVTPHIVRYSDREERRLAAELGVTVAIRDGSYVTSHINDDVATRAAFRHHLEHYTDFLKSIGASRRIPSTQHVKSPAVYVYLAQEVERRRGNESLVDSVTDALALWALEGTDPDKGIVRTAEEVMEKIVGTVPSVQSIVAPRIVRRLQHMGKKDYPLGRAVKWYRKAGTFCLPWETRQKIEDENAADETLRLRVLESLEMRAKGDDDVCVDSELAARVALRAIQNIFEREGLEFSRYLQEGAGSQYPTVVDSLSFALEDTKVTHSKRENVGDGAFRALRGVFYDSVADEREYLRKLSQTYALLFTLNTEPRLVKFFQEMASDLRLYVGADQLLLALSEKFLPEADRATNNMLTIASELGAKLILTEPALEEVVSHLRACDFEHRNHINGHEESMGFELVREVPHLILRSYLYAKFTGDPESLRPKNWPEYLNHFCTPETLHGVVGMNDIRRYLQNSFGLDYESTDDLETLVDPDAVLDLTSKLAEHKKTERLAHNDALIALAVYGRRRRRRESSGTSEFGWSTWWLTSETRILQYTRDVVRDRGARYMMRPDFLLNYVALSPKTQAIRDSMAGLFPSLLGVQLGRRISSDDFHGLMGRVKEAERLEPARRSVEIAKLSDTLKSDFRRSYAGGTESATRSGPR